jgi:hypothetical protein
MQDVSGWNGLDRVLIAGATDVLVGGLCVVGGLKWQNEGEALR